AGPALVASDRAGSPPAWAASSRPCASMERCSRRGHLAGLEGSVEKLGNAVPRRSAARGDRVAVSGSRHEDELLRLAGRLEVPLRVRGGHDVVGGAVDE